MRLLQYFALAGGRLFLRRSRKSSLHPVVQDLLEHAIDKRSVMLVEFPAHELSGGGSFLGPCVKFDEKTVLIDVSLKKEPSGWLGEAVQVSFKIDAKGASSYYQFVSRLRELPHSLGGFGMLLDVPQEITSNQKRSFVRVSLDKEDTFGVGVWLLDHVQGRPEDPASLGAAQASCRRDTQEELSLLNVSAGGLCLMLKRPPEGQLPIDPQAGERLLCLLMLRSLQEEGQTMPFWLDCGVMNRVEKDNGDQIVLGLHFKAWAVQHGADGVRWFSVGEDGAVGPLATWVLRRQLAQLGKKKSVKAVQH